VSRTSSSIDHDVEKSLRDKDGMHDLEDEGTTDEERIVDAELASPLASKVLDS
jgi:hypothetical protein